MISLLSSFANLMQNWNPLLVVIIVEIFGNMIMVYLSVNEQARMRKMLEERILQQETAHGEILQELKFLEGRMRT